MTDDSLLTFDLPAVRRKKVTPYLEDGLISSDGVPGPVAQGGTLLTSGHDAGRLHPGSARPATVVVHRLPAMLRFLIFAIACGYNDAEDFNAKPCEHSRERVLDLRVKPLSTLEIPPTRTDILRSTNYKQWVLGREATMAPEEEGREGPESGEVDFEGRDLLVGRPEGAEGRSSAGTARAPPAAMSPQPDAHDDAIREILETVRATAARIDALEGASGPEHETAEALARETAALRQAVEDAHGALAKAAELATRQDGQASAGARALAEGAAALKTQGEALDKRLRATGRQAEAAAQGMDEMKQTAMALDSRLRSLGEDILRIVDSLPRRAWLLY